ncbi:MAG: prepilin-type N-terminal cleavage/methylation domain-containing protein, partial [Candidatus Peribacteraceae bacterium]|nr:prepilin-type N-terminal cleavage/methylation domain-containing protein [Candidatus Peribacteraceae bacterium]
MSLFIKKRNAFTLIELLLVIGIISIMLGVVMLAIRPAEQLLKARDTERLSMRKEMQSAIHQYMIEYNRVINEGEFRIGNLDGARPFCRYGVTDDSSCINVDDVTPDYISDLPYDDREVCTNYSGYKAYIDKDKRPIIISMRLNEQGTMRDCLWDGLAGYWPMYENTGSLVGDLSSGSNVGTLNESASRPEGMHGNTISFDGTKEISIANSAILQITGDQSICMWLYPLSLASRKSVLEKAYGGEGSIIQETNGSLTYYYGTNGGNSSPSQSFASNSAVVSENNWTHACI